VFDDPCLACGTRHEAGVDAVDADQRGKQVHRGGLDFSHDVSLGTARSWDADEAWWPPTLTPLEFGRPWLATSTMAVESHSTR
jgi:hypothetical protein